jgi:lysophospholipase L1-like esterase
MRRHRLFTLGLIVAFLAFLEAGSYGVGRYLTVSKGIFYAPHVKETYGDYITRLDPWLGWPSHTAYRGPLLDAAGSRQVPAFPDPARQPPCVSLYGDSFTWGEDVDHEHAWGNVLARLLKCRVANYGVAGYGADQAYLRFHLKKDDPARIVIFGFLSENITRHVGQFRNLAAPTPQFQIKPRFILNGRGELQLIPIPFLSSWDYPEFIQHPERFLNHEYFLPGGPSGVQRLTFPYTLSLLNTYKRFYIRAFFTGEPRYAEFYRPHHSSRALGVTLKIIESFYQEARAQGRHPIVVIFPTGYDLQYYVKKQVWVYEPVIEQLKARQVDFINLGQELLPYLQGGSPCRLFINDFCGGHFNDEGNRLVAEIVYRHLSRALMPTAQPTH